MLSPLEQKKGAMKMSELEIIIIINAGFALSQLAFSLMLISRIAKLEAAENERAGNAQASASGFVCSAMSAQAFRRAQEASEELQAEACMEESAK